MITVKDKTNCSGCTACAMACPKNAISMVQDDEGFKYPIVSTETCIECGVCDNVCSFNITPPKPLISETFAVKHTDAEILRLSTSGGIFTAISDYIISSGGAVYGAAFDKDMVVHHTRATVPDERNKMRGSKYVQSDLGDTFKSVKNDLNSGMTVLFVGTPCQISGLKSFLHGKCDKLICCDLICHGVPSPLIFNEHLKLLSKKSKRTITGYEFRPKRWGWHIHQEIITYDGNKKVHSTPYSELWRQIYYSRIAMRPSCSNCSFSNLYRCGDITIGDCRGIDNVSPDFGSYDGVSLVMVNTTTGLNLFNNIRHSIKYEAIDINAVLQPPLRTPSKANPRYYDFFADYKSLGYEKAIKKLYGALYPLKFYVKKILRKKQSKKDV